MKGISKLLLCLLVVMINGLSFAQEQEDERLLQRYMQPMPEDALLVFDEVRSRSGEVLGEVKVYDIDGEGLIFIADVPDDYLTPKEELRAENYTIGELYYLYTGRTPMPLIQAELELERNKKALEGVELLQAKPLSGLSFCDADPVNYPSWPEPKKPCSKVPPPHPDPGPGGPGDRKPVDPPEPDPGPDPDPGLIPDEPIPPPVICDYEQPERFLVLYVEYNLDFECSNMMKQGVALSDWVFGFYSRVNHVRGLYDSDDQIVDFTFRYKMGKWYKLTAEVKPGKKYSLGWWTTQRKFELTLKPNFVTDDEKTDFTIYDFKVGSVKYGWSSYPSEEEMLFNWPPAWVWLPLP